MAFISLNKTNSYTTGQEEYLHIFSSTRPAREAGALSIVDSSAWGPVGVSVAGSLTVQVSHN
jgi:hypothetical protein